MSEALSAACDGLAPHPAEGAFGFSALRAGSHDLYRIVMKNFASLLLLVATLSFCCCINAQESVPQTLPKQTSDTALYELLGLMDACQPIIEGDDRVEVFYANERASSEVAVHMAKELMENEHVVGEITTNITREGNIAIINKSVAARLRGYFSGKKFGDFYTDSTGKHEVWNGCIDRGMLFKADKGEKRAYLLGSYIRNGQNLYYHFRTMYAASLVAELLIAVGEKDVNIKSDDENCPTCLGSAWDVFVTPSDDTRQLFRQAEEARRKGAAPLLP